MVRRSYCGEYRRFSTNSQHPGSRSLAIHLGERLHPAYLSATHPLRVSRMLNDAHPSVNVRKTLNPSEGSFRMREGCGLESFYDVELVHNLTIDGLEVAVRLVWIAVYIKRDE